MPTEVSNVSNETVLHHTLEAMKTKRAIDEATGAHRAVLKRAKADGCDTSAITYAIRAKKLDVEDVRIALRNQIRVLSVLAMPVTQTDLFSDLDLATVNSAGQSALMAANARDAGYNDGKLGAPIENCPHLAGTEPFVEWRAGWNEGQDFLVRNMPEGAKPADPRRKKLRGGPKTTKPARGNGRKAPRASAAH